MEVGAHLKNSKLHYFADDMKSIISSLNDNKKINFDLASQSSEGKMMLWIYNFQENKSSIKWNSIWVVRELDKKLASITRSLTRRAITFK